MSSHLYIHVILLTNGHQGGQYIQSGPGRCHRHRIACCGDHVFHQGQAHRGPLYADCIDRMSLRFHSGLASELISLQQWVAQEWPETRHSSNDADESFWLKVDEQLREQVAEFKTPTKIQE